jgi:RNA polymerase sigma-70 factor (ECF subfamily)
VSRSASQAQARYLAVAAQPGMHAHAPPTSGPQLLAAIARGDDAAFSEFYRSWFPRIYAAAVAATGRDESFCLDVVQDTMLRLIRSTPRAASDGELAVWLRKTMISASMDALRAESRRRRREAASSTVGGAADERDTDERLDWLAFEFANLPESDRELLTLRFARGLSLQQSGDATGKSGPAAHGLIRRTLERLRRTIEDITP